jgi:SAM-dependent methyltransferase
LDFVAGPGVDVVIELGKPYPVSDDAFDFVMASSVVEHDALFWITFLEMCRMARPGGYIYISAPANGKLHRHPEDNWRFYPDTGKSLVRLSQSQGINVVLVESFTAERESDNWNDYCAIWAPPFTGRQSGPDVIPCSC